MCIYNPKISFIASLFGVLYYSQNHSNFSISKNCLILIGQYLYPSPFNLLYTARSVKIPPVNSSPARSMPSSRKPRRWGMLRLAELATAHFIWMRLMSSSRKAKSQRVLTERVMMPRPKNSRESQ